MVKGLQKKCPLKGPVTKETPVTALRREHYFKGSHDQSQRSLTPPKREPDPRAQKPASHKAVITVMTGPGIPKLQTIVLLKKAISWFLDIKLFRKISA